MRVITSILADISIIITIIVLGLPTLLFVILMYQLVIKDMRTLGRA